MKHTLFAGLLLVVFIYVGAETNKPTKEESIGLINTLGKQANGEIISSEGSDEPGISVKTSLKDFHFTGNSCSITTVKDILFKDGSKAKATITKECLFNLQKVVNVSGIIWDRNPELGCVTVRFSGDSVKVILTGIESYTGTTDFEIYPDRYYKPLLIMYCPAGEIESIKNAFLRLREIAKEENKDHFAN